MRPLGRHSERYGLLGLQFLKVEKAKEEALKKNEIMEPEEYFKKIAASGDV